MSADAQFLRRSLDAALTPAARRSLDATIALCADANVELYLVGGAVRDLRLGRDHVDLDLALEGPVDEVADELARQFGGRAVHHPRFGTAGVTGRGFHLDLAQTRRETYDHPGALPQVEPVTSILDDLSRRDFSINAVALKLTPAIELIDPFGGLADLKARRLRALHEASFKDDATRMLRAVRYAARLDLRIEPRTASWLRRDLPYVGSVSGPRLRRELTLIFREASAPAAISMAAGQGVLPGIHPGLGLSDKTRRSWSAALSEGHQAPLDELGFCLISDPRSRADVRAVTARLHLTAREQKALGDLVRLRDLSDKLDSANGVPERVVDLLEGLAPAAIWAFSILNDGPAGDAARQYLRVWRKVRPLLDGNDLLALGVPQGEKIGAILRRLRAARLEGRLDDRQGEIDFVRAAMAREGGIDG